VYFRDECCLGMGREDTNRRTWEANPVTLSRDIGPAHAGSPREMPRPVSTHPCNPARVSVSIPIRCGPRGQTMWGPASRFSRTHRRTLSYDRASGITRVGARRGSQSHALPEVDHPGADPAREPTA